MAAPYQDLFARRAATPYSGPPVAPPVVNNLPTTTPPVVPPTPTTGGVVGGGQATGNALNPIDTSYNYTQPIGRGAPKNTGAVPGNPIDTSYNYTQTIGRGAPGNTGAVPGDTTPYNSPLIGRGAPVNTGAVPERGITTTAAQQARVRGMLGITAKPVVAAKPPVDPNATRAKVAAKLGITQQPAKPVVKNTFMADQRAKTAKLLRGGR